MERRCRVCLEPIPDDLEPWVNLCADCENQGWTDSEDDDDSDSQPPLFFDPFNNFDNFNFI